MEFSVSTLVVYINGEYLKDTPLLPKNLSCYVNCIRQINKRNSKKSSQIAAGHLDLSRVFRYRLIVLLRNYVLPAKKMNRHGVK
jgi:hypothetical protein